GCGSVLQGPDDAGGTGGRPGAAPYDHPTGADDVLVSVKAEGGFLPLEYNLRNTAQFLLLGDGTVIVPGVMIEIYPGPAIRPLQAARVTEGQIQELFAAAEEAGLLEGQIDYGEPGVTDVPTTTVTLTSNGRTVSHSAYALSYPEAPDANLSAEQLAAREALQGFIDAAQGLAGADSQQYVPNGVVAYRISSESAPPVDEGLDPEPMVWPIATAPETPVIGIDSCIEVIGAEAQTLLEALGQANELTPWMIGSDPPTPMVFRPLLPGDPGCAY
ncbi:MAG: hypothetical protein M3313_16505, partial [Actinomycetota bacterium]|nr:hypothetical protein [Actinomycetota bacterium]